MQNVHTSVLTRRVRITSTFATVPYEAGWASEAVFFTQVEGKHPALTVTTEISPDGIAWIPRGEEQKLDSESFMAANSLAVFGNWIRITIDGATDIEPARVLVHLVLKG